jgi:hypothetical protein
VKRKKKKKGACCEQPPEQKTIKAVKLFWDLFMVKREQSPPEFVQSPIPPPLSQLRLHCGLCLWGRTRPPARMLLGKKKKKIRLLNLTLLANQYLP